MLTLDMVCCRLPEAGHRMDQGRRRHQAPPGLGAPAEMVARAGGGDHARLRQLHVHRVQRTRNGLLHLQAAHSRYT